MNIISFIKVLLSLVVLFLWTMLFVLLISNLDFKDDKFLGLIFISLIVYILGIRFWNGKSYKKEKVNHWSNHHKSMLTKNYLKK